MDPYLFKRLWRRPWLSLCCLVLSGVLCFLLCFLSGYEQEQQKKLTETQDSFEILCVVTNVKGTQSTSLHLSSSFSYFMTSPDYEMHRHIKDLRMTKEFEMSCPALGISNSLLTGVTNERCAEALNPALGGGTNIWTEGFYESEQPLCLVSEGHYEGLGDAETIRLSLTDPAVDSMQDPDSGKGIIEFQIAGTYKGNSDAMYMPFNASQVLSSQISQKCGVDSIAFLAADNRNLEALSQAASEKLCAVDPLAEDRALGTAALTIHDEQFNATVAALEQNIERTRYLLPLVSVLGLGVGFLSSFLATRGERRTYALMRTLGMTKGKLFASIVREQMLLPLFIVLLISLLTGEFLPALFYLLCNTIGCCAAVVRSVRVPPTAILREQE